MSWASSEGDAAASSYASPDGGAKASTRHGSRWLRRIVLLLVVLAAGYLVAAYMKWLPSFIPNLLERFGLA